jgi:hypothetical protein
MEGFISQSVNLELGTPIDIGVALLAARQWTSPASRQGMARVRAALSFSNEAKTATRTEIYSSMNPQKNFSSRRHGEVLKRSSSYFFKVKG